MKSLASITVGKPWHVNVTGEFAYVVVPVGLSFQREKKTTKDGDTRHDSAQRCRRMAHDGMGLVRPLGPPKAESLRAKEANFKVSPDAKIPKFKTAHYPGMRGRLARRRVRFRV
jgi:hypothetical protein